MRLLREPHDRLPPRTLRLGMRSVSRILLSALEHLRNHPAPLLCEDDVTEPGTERGFTEVQSGLQSYRVDS